MELTSIAPLYPEGGESFTLFGSLFLYGFYNSEILQGSLTTWALSYAICSAIFSFTKSQL